MKETLQKFLQSYSPSISDENVESFASITKYKKFSKGDIVVHYGKPTSNIYIIKTGFVGDFIRNNKECKKIIRTLYTPGKSFGAISSLIQRKESNASYNCLTDCKIYQTDFNAFLKLKEEKQEFKIVYGKFLEEIFLKSERKIDELCLLTSTQRYLKLLKDIPNVTNILPQYQIAYHLNITPVQLSRIRKKLLTS